MLFRITGLWFGHPARNRVPAGTAVLFDQDAPDGDAPSGGTGRSDSGLPVGQKLRRSGAILVVAGLALPGVTVTRGPGGPAGVAVVEAGLTGRPEESTVSRDAGDAAGRGGVGETRPGLPGAAGGPWEAGVVEADGKPLPAAPPPGPVPVDGIPQAASPSTGTTPAAPAPGRTAPSAPGGRAGASGERPDDLVPADREYLRPVLIRYAQENGLPADLVMSLAWVESSWRRNAVSDAGAVGVMQIMPNTVEFVSKKLLALRSNLDPGNATSNVRMGTRYLRHMLDQNGGNVRRALIAYNQGLTSLRANGSYSGAERYADRVLALRPQFRSA